jgi:hypothetical protein
MTDNNGAILFYSPEAGVTPHFIASCLLAKTMQHQGHQVLFALCFELLPRCPVMDMVLLPYPAPAEQRKALCMQCANGFLTILNHYGLPYVDLREVISADAIQELSDVADSLPANLLDFEYKEIKFGKMCAMDLILAKKVLDLENTSKEIRGAWEDYIASSLISYMLVDSLCSKLKIKAITHFNDYGILSSASLAGRKYGIPFNSFTLAPHMNNDRRKFIIADRALRQFFLQTRNAWQDWRELTLTRQQVSTITDDSLVRLSGTGSHTYSPPKTANLQLHKQLGLDTNKKLLVAYTSGLDEMYANLYFFEALGLDRSVGEQPFDCQIEWLKALTQFIEARPDMQLVVRIHPREGINRRSNIPSAHLELLKDAFEGKDFHNCRFIWPESTVSSYDLGEAADLVLTSWSTIGLEMARLGVPVLTATQGYEAFPHDIFLEWGATPKDYFEKLLYLIDIPSDIERIRKAYRWYYLYTLAGSLNLGDIIPSSDFEGLPVFTPPKESKAIEAAILGKDRILNINTERQRSIQDPQTAEEEVLELKFQMRRIIRLLCTGRNEYLENKLYVFECPFDDLNVKIPTELMENDQQELILLCNNSMIRYVSHMDDYQRHSPMCVRLARMSADHFCKVESKDVLEHALNVDPNEPKTKHTSKSY